MSSMKVMLYTIGHSNLSPGRFLDLLRLNQIEVVADVRSKPFSKKFPHFNAPELKGLLASEGLLYVHLGKELGGRPLSSDLYDADGHADYAKMSKTPLFQKGIKRLRQGMRHYRIALLCSEEDPNECHRRLLIVRVLCEEDPGLRDKIFHIRADGSLQSELELYRREQAEKPLFEEVRLWRSPKSILLDLQRKAQKSSSDV
jgi:uncharacterized protein (DUF488 family)